ncbi:MAG: hypothetical protein J0M07_29130, partial [Anaerolineae bacterium]|nr:hypothetical protein [Anaerolineae bacterium]
QIGIAPYANCFTNVPTSWVRLFWQRCRWDRTVVTFECRKHADIGFPWNKHFTLPNAFLMLERWIFNVVCVFTFWLYGAWVFLEYPQSAMRLLGLLYCCGLCVEFLQLLVLLFYSDRLKHDLILAADVFVYAGDLAGVTNYAHAALTSNGVVAFTVQALPDGDYQLGHDQRFSHSESYIRRVLSAFASVSVTPGTFRRDRDKDVPGLLVLAEKL